MCISGFNRVHLKRRNRVPALGLHFLSEIRDDAKRKPTHSFSQPACSTRPLSLAHGAAAERQQGEVSWRNAPAEAQVKVQLRVLITFTLLLPRAAMAPHAAAQGQGSTRAGNRTVSREGKKETCSFSDRAVLSFKGQLPHRERV